MKGPAQGLLWTAVSACSLVAIPAAARVGLLILGTAPNPRHPPGDVMGEAVGWAIVAAVVGAVGAMAGEAMFMPDRVGFFGTYRGLVLGSLAGIELAALLGAALAVLQMNSVDGQAITSVCLGVLAGAAVGTLGAMAGAVAGSILKRVVEALVP